MQLEEREAVKGRICTANFDHLGHLDERLELVFGDCRKDFEGNLSSRKLSTTVGEYGSFLRTQVSSDATLITPSLAPAGVPGAPSMFEKLNVRVPGDGSELAPGMFARVSPIATETNGHIQTNSNCYSDSVQDSDLSSDVSSPDESPNSMIQLFRTHVIPGGGLLSPLILSSGLHLMKKGAEGEGLKQGKILVKKKLEEGEVEEGEVCLADFDHLNHLNEMLELVLGDFRKEFQGGLPSRTLSTTGGEYGSFLRTQVPREAVLTTPSLAPSGVRGPPSLIEELKMRFSGDGSMLVKERFAKVSLVTTEIKGPLQTSSNCLNHSRLDPDVSFAVSSPDISPNSMIERFTTHIIPGGGLLSPLIQRYSKPKSGKRMRRDEVESEYQVEKWTVSSRCELDNCGSSAADRLLAERLRELENRPSLALIYNEQIDRQKDGSKLLSPAFSSSKVSCSAWLPALGSKRESSSGSTLQAIGEVLQNNHPLHNQSSCLNPARNRRKSAHYSSRYNKPESGKRIRRDDLESDHEVAKRTVSSKCELDNCGSAAAERLLAERLQELENRPGLALIYNEQRGQQKDRSQLLSPPFSSSKVSCSAGLSALGSIGGSSIGSTLYPTSEVLQSNHTLRNQSSGGNPASNRRIAQCYKNDRNSCLGDDHSFKDCWETRRDDSDDSSWKRAKRTNYYAEIGSKYRDELYRKRGQC